MRTVTGSYNFTEAARVSGTAREGRAMKHRLFALFRERYGCKYTLLPRKRYREAAIMLLDEPLAKLRQSSY